MPQATASSSQSRAATAPSAPSPWSSVRCRPPPSLSRPAADLRERRQRTGRAPSRARYADGVIAEVIEVDGVHCPRCIEKIAAALQGVQGLAAADANLMGEITVQLDDDDARERVHAAI